eukprot:3230158-Amphidinium_carterae.1
MFDRGVWGFLTLEFKTVSGEVLLFGDVHCKKDILDWLDFGDPLPAVAAKLKEHFPLYNFGYDEDSRITSAFQLSTQELA